MFRGIEHIGLMAEDTEKLASWYEKLFNFKVVYKNKKTPPTFFVTGESGSMIEIMPYKAETKILSGNERRYTHLAIEVDDFDQAYTHLKNAGVNFCGEPREASGGVKVVFFLDPEENQIQLIYRPNPLR